MSALEDATACAAENQTQLARGRARTSIIKVMLLMLGGLMAITWLSNLSNQLTSQPANHSPPAAEVAPTGEPMTLATALRDYKVADAACERASLALEHNIGSLQDAMDACGDSFRVVSDLPALYGPPATALQSCIDMEGARVSGLWMISAIREHRGDPMQDQIDEGRYRRNFHLASIGCNAALVTIQRAMSATQ